MPDLDLKPDDYRVKGPQGRWFQRDDKRFIAGWLIFDLIMLGVVWWYRDSLSADVLFWSAAFLGAMTGIAFALLTKDIY